MTSFVVVAAVDCVVVEVVCVVVVVEFVFVVVVGGVEVVVVLLQTSKPSSHVWSNHHSCGCPHLRCQDPPGLQHVRPRGLGTHLGHTAHKTFYVVNIMESAQCLFFH